ncbi:VOC family protein [Rhodococcus phenolicus]|uniref:VOC family protein n=1 Tax=Rhodococcus phenolicus TaxID=263849 RepID=UPI00082A2C1A|nr:VOC family protein [Rhodococcus phenolicus]
MPEHNSRTGTPGWIDLTSSDPKKAIEFYRDLFGWQADTNEDPQYGGYTIFSHRGAPIAGLGPQQPGNPYGDVWTVYLDSEDADATAQKAASAGGQVMMPAMKVGDQGTMAILADPAGAVIGVWQADQHHGFGFDSEPGAPVWFETMSQNYAGSLAFYREVFGWDCQPMSDSGDFRYSTGKIGGEDIAGIMDASVFLPEGVPSFWQVYIGVEDADAASTLVTKLGGTVERAAEDTPFGRMATITDPLGARLLINQAPPR